MSKRSKDEVVYTTNRGKIICMRAVYAKETPEYFWEDVYEMLRRMGVFDGLSK